MKSVLILLAVAMAVMSMSAAADPAKPIAEIPSTTTVDPNKSADELRALIDQMTPEQRSQIEALARGFDVAVPADKQTQKQEKTIADVADRALTMTEGMVGKLSKTLEQVAPEVWRIMYKQQYAKAVSMIVGPMLWIVVCILIMIIGTKVWITKAGLSKMESDSNGDYDFYFGLRLIGFQIIPAFVATVTALIFASTANQIVMLLINPEYYAIQDLLRMILAGGRIS